MMRMQTRGVLIGLALAGWPQAYRWLLLAAGPALLWVLGWFFYFAPQLAQQRFLQQQQQHLQRRLILFETQAPALDRWPRPAAPPPANTTTAAGFWPGLLQATERSGSQLESFQPAAGRGHVHFRVLGAYRQLTALFAELATADFASVLHWCRLRIAPASTANHPEALGLEAEVQLEGNTGLAKPPATDAGLASKSRVRP